jgi:hypothetical protein
VTAKEKSIEKATEATATAKANAKVTVTVTVTAKPYNNLKKLLTPCGFI